MEIFKRTKLAKKVQQNFDSKKTFENLKNSRNFFFFNAVAMLPNPSTTGVLKPSVDNGQSWPSRGALEARWLHIGRELQSKLSLLDYERYVFYAQL